MKCTLPHIATGILMAAACSALAHEGGHSHSDEAGGFSEAMRDEIAARYRVVETSPAVVKPVLSAQRNRRTASSWMPAFSASSFSQMLGLGSLAALQNGGGSVVSLYSPPAGNGSLMIASFAPFRPIVRFYNDGAYFYVEGDSMPDATLMPTPMVGITAWQQQLPIPVGYFGNVTNPESDAGALGFGQPNVWRIPMVPVPAASPISLNGNFLRGAVAIGSNGIPIFNPRNNTGQFSQAIGELDIYGGHCGRADDYHYHIAPTHLYSVLTPDKPCAWALDGYPIYGYVEPDGSAQQALDVDGGHNHGAWGYHYHARGTFNSGTSTWTPANPYLMNAMHGTVVNYGGQIDPQPTASSIAPAGSPLAGAVITGFARPAKDSYDLTYTVSGTTYHVTYSINRIAHTVTVSHQTPTDPTGTPATYTNASRFSYYPMTAASMLKLPDTGQTLNATATAGEDSDYTINPPSFTDNANGTISDNVTGLMWQKTDAGEMTWDNAVAGAASVSLGGFTDWRLPTAQEAFSILDHDRNPALNPAYFVANASGTPGYWWTSDLFYGDNTKVWATNAGGGIGPHPKTSTISAGGALRFHARYVRGAKPTIGHNYQNNNDGSVTDLDTGLMWTQVPSSAMTWTAALTYAEGLTTAGFTDWRLPNVKELQSLEDIARATASATTTVPCLNRTLFPAATATAYWSSTSVKSGSPTQAWLVDFGVTTTSTPSRNQQGIVSYEPYASSYPVFAVRGPVVTTTTQIGVEQPAGTTLGDGVSVVGYGSVNVGSTTTKTFTVRNNGATSLSISGVTIDGADAALFAITSPPATLIASGAATTMTVQFSATTAGAKTAALHIASSDTAVGTAFDVTLTGTGVIPPPTITNTLTSPNTPTYVDSVFVTARLQAASGASITSAQLTYGDGSLTTGPVFTESMAAAAVTPWTGTNADNPWTVNGTANTIKQVTAANHGTGNPCGLQFDKGTVTITDNYATTTNNIAAVGTAGYVEFWLGASSLISPNGWTFQLSTDSGATWTTRLSELTGLNHAMQLYRYDLLVTERVNTLKMRFQFVGYNAVAPTPAPKVNIDDITVVTTSGNPPAALTMFDDGLHGDGLAGDGIYGAQIPVRTAGTTITYSLSATDSNGSTTTSAAAASYTVSAVTPPATFAATATPSGNNVTLQWPTQTGISYSVQTSEDLINWTNIPVGQVATWTDPGALGAAPKRFYRVMR